MRKKLKKEEKQIQRKLDQLLQFERMQEIAQTREGKLLSEEYINTYTHLLWQCKNNHQWISTPSNIKLGHWCPHCIRTRPNIDIAEKEAQSKKGRCLSSEVKYTKDKLNWICKNGHEWSSSYHSVTKSNSWCMKCFLMGEKKI